MKRVLKRILIFVIVFMSFYQKCSHADLVMEKYNPQNVYNSLFTTCCVLMALVCMIIITIVFFYYLVLKWEIISEENKKEKMNSEIVEKKKQSIQIVQHIFYVCGVVLTIACYFYSAINDLIPIEMLKIPSLIIFTISLFVSIILRLFKRVKASNIICAILLVVLIFGIKCNARIESNILSFNNRFEKYASREPKYDTAGYNDRIMDVYGFIEEVRNNNELNRKITLTYDDREYMFNDELDELLNEIDKKLEKNVGLYIGEITYDSQGYIETISLYSAYHPEGGVDRFNANIIQYNGNQTGSQVKALLNHLISSSKTYTDSNEKEKIVEVVVVSGGIDRLDIFYEDGSDHSIETYQNALRELSGTIRLKHTYFVKPIIDEEYGIYNKVMIFYSEEEAK